ncbi:MAG TPA: TonB family protein [Gemmatimonadaceae bacterium]|nr:TonB family protein [Gemmatimonadaceae bacterium]
MRPILLVLVTLGLFASNAAAQLRLRQIKTVDLGDGDSVSVSATNQGRVLIAVSHGWEHAQVMVNPDSLGPWLDTTQKIVAEPAPRDTRETVLDASPRLRESIIIDGHATRSGDFIEVLGAAGGRAQGLGIHIGGDDILSVTVTMLKTADFHAFATALRQAITATREMTPASMASADRAGSVDQDSIPAPVYGATRALPSSPEKTYYSFQVETQAQPLEGNPAPAYPAALQAAHTDGQVLAEFVVDTTGRVDMTTFKVTMATDERFVEALMQVLPRWRFRPAETAGHRVRQFIQMPLTFTFQ